MSFLLVLARRAGRFGFHRMLLLMAAAAPAGQGRDRTMRYVRASSPDERPITTRLREVLKESRLCSISCLPFAPDYTDSASPDVSVRNVPRLAKSRPRTEAR